jgi:hypothetical protein
MAKLYWRVKVNGKWTWKPAIIDTDIADYNRVSVIVEEEEE